MSKSRHASLVKYKQMEQTWRQYYRPKIYSLIMDNKHLPLNELKKLLCNANPGQYGHMKKIWANEYMRQLKELGIIEQKPNPGAAFFGTLFDSKNVADGDSTATRMG